MDTSRRNFVQLAAATALGGVTTYAIAGDWKKTATEQPILVGYNRDGQSTRSEGLIRKSGSFYVPPEAGIEGIQRVIDDHAPNVSIVLGVGRYVGSELTLRNDVRLLGAGADSTILRLSDNANTDLVVSPNPDEQVSLRINARDITFDGNRQHNSSGDLVYGAFWNSRFSNCEFVEAPEDGFWLAGSSDGSTDDNVFRNCRFARCGSNALRLGANRDAGSSVGVTHIDTCWFGKNDGNAARIRGNGNSVVNGKFYANSGADVFLDRGYRNLILNNDISKTTAATPCISILSDKGVTSSRNRVDGNTIFGSYRDAIYAEAAGNDVVGLQVHDNNIRGRVESDDVTRNGIRAVGEVFLDCSARDNTLTGTFANSAIQLPSSWDVSGNTS